MRREVERLYVEFGGLVYRRCLRMLRDEEAAYDAVQEVFLRLLSPSAQVGALRVPAAYLYRMATNVCLNLLRRDRGRAVLTLEAAEDLPDGRDDGMTASLLLDILSAGLGRGVREVAYLRYADGMGLDEIAGLLGLSRSTVRKRLDKLKERARRHKERIL